jgi:hypothetical protein
VLDIGPPVSVGDPDGIRALAATVDAIATQLSGENDQLKAVFPAMDFNGPLHDQIAAEVDGASTAVATQVGALRAIASDLRATAGRVVTQQAQVNAQWQAAQQAALKRAT